MRTSTGRLPARRLARSYSCNILSVRSCEQPGLKSGRIGALTEAPGALPFLGIAPIRAAVYKRACSRHKVQGVASPSAEGSGVVSLHVATTAKVEVGDATANLGPALTAVVRQPTYEVHLTYRGQGRVLHGAHQVWAHIGHSGWQDVQDVALQHNADDPEVWSGSYRLSARRLPVAWQLDCQVVFKGMVGNQERWDNNGGSNWVVAAKLAPGEGMVVATQGAPVPRSLVSSLLLRTEALAASKMLTPEQVALLRLLAWQKDFALLKMYEQVQYQPDTSVAQALRTRCGALERPGLYVVHIAAEMAPIAKVGGLADVVTSLAKVHQAEGNMVEVIVPKYDCIQYKNVQELRVVKEMYVPWGAGAVRTLVWSGIAEGLPVYFVEPHSEHKYFWRGRFYGEPDDETRFLFFSRAALELLASYGKRPDVVHAHDWQSAGVAPLVREAYRASSLATASVVLTIHNMAFQGWLRASALQEAGITLAADKDGKVLTGLRDMPDWVEDDKHVADAKPVDPDYKWVNMLRGAVIYADKVTTVSPTYAHEVFQPVFGMGMQGILSKHAYKFAGVLNGIDGEMWDPATDPHLPVHYSAESLQGKEECKRRLLGELGLPYAEHDKRRPLLVVVSRLTTQKGLPLIRHGLEVAMKRGAQIVVLGTASEKEVQAEWEAWAAELQRGGDGRLMLRHDEGLSHRIFAGADMILIPSMFEPCGLTQLIAFRYGTIPVVRRTGGLADTVRDVAHATCPEHERNGFVFTGQDKPAVEQAVHRALDAYHNGYGWWREALVPRVMRQDWSWGRSAHDYLNIYKSVLRK